MLTETAPITQIRFWTYLTAIPTIFRMAAKLDILAVADALEQAGMDTRLAHVCATQMHIVANARPAVTRPELDNSMKLQSAKFMQKMAEFKVEITHEMAESKTEVMAALAATRDDLQKAMTAQFWRFFAALLTLLGLAVAAIRYLPPVSGG